MTATPAHSHEDHIGKITVSGTGNSYQAPDIATVSTGVVTQASTAQEALSDNNRQMNATIDALLAAGILRRHIQTSQLSLNPRYDYSKTTREQRIVGYEARNTVSARSEDISSVGDMIDALVKAGANNINGINFGIKDAEGAKSEARREAVKSARRKAEEMALAAGVRLGRIVQMSESSQGFRPPQPMMMRASMGGMADESAPVEGGEQTLSVTVSITYAIED